MDQFIFDYSEWISFIGSLVTVIAFGITIWQLVVANKRITKVEQTTKIKLKRTLNLVLIVETISMIRLLQELLKHKEWSTVVFQMSQLHTSLVDISAMDDVGQYVRPDFSDNVSQMSSDLNLLRNYKKQKPDDQTINSVNRNFDLLIENLILIQNKLK